jgi:hypothetical protein
MSQPFYRVLDSKYTRFLTIAIVLAAVILNTFFTNVSMDRQTKSIGFEAIKAQLYRLQGEIITWKTHLENFKYTVESITVDANNPRQRIITHMNTVYPHLTGYVGMWFEAEKNKIGGLDKHFIGAPGAQKNTGRFAPYWHMLNLKDKYFRAANEIFDLSPWYLRPKVEKKTLLIEPFFYESLMLASVVAPVYQNQQFIGSVGIDRYLGHIQESLEKSQPFKSSTWLLTSDKGSIIANPYGLKPGDNLNQYPLMLDWTQKAKQQPLSINTNPLTRQKQWTFYARESISGWNLFLNVDEKEILTPFYLNMALFSLLTITILSFFLVLFRRYSVRFF